MQYLTITTDAGIKNDVAAFGFYIRAEKLKITRSGVFKKHTKNSTIAELWCIIKAVTFVGKHIPLNSIDNIILNTDSQEALRLINNKFDGKIYEDLKPLYDVAIRQLNKPFEVRHVKGHTNSRKARNRANTYVDKLIRKHYKN